MTGIKRNLPAAEYHAIDACSASRLKDMRRSPSHCLFHMTHPRQSDAMELGKALHDCVLLPEVYESEYVVSQKFDRRTKEGKEGAKAFAGANAGKSIIDEDMHGKIHAMSISIMSHPMASHLLSAPGECELSLFWDDPQTGIACKARADKYVPSLRSLVDVKTTQDAAPRSFPRSINQFGYALQAAFYLEAARRCGLDAEHFVFICVESEPPFGRQVYELDAESIAKGETQYRKLLNRYAECKSACRWPSYGDEIEIISLPAWAE